MDLPLAVDCVDEYSAALRAVETLMSATAGSPEGERLDALVSWIEAYERQHLPMTQAAAH